MEIVNNSPPFFADDAEIENFLLKVQRGCDLANADN
jgi:hypothetical protein